MKIRKILPIIFFLFASLPACSGEKATNTQGLPPGFQISPYATAVGGARSLALGDNGTIFVGTRSEGNVYALVDTNADYKADSKYVIDQGLNMPNGVAFRNGALYVAEVNRILRYDDIENNLTDPPEPAVVFGGYPSDMSHGWKFMAFGPDGKLYVPVGAPCNICESDEEIYASITRLNPDGSGLEIYARGIRNTVGFAWHPQTGELWFTDNGRDWLGDDIPPDELNHAPQAGLHFGYPYCHGGDIPDPEFGQGRNCSEFRPPAMKLGPHVASLGMRFYTGTMFPEEYRNQIFIAEHGSWNRSEPLGYRITLVRLEGSMAKSYEVFVDAWPSNIGIRGRPVDLLIMPDGSMLVSDDKNDAVYRISYQK